MTLDRLLWWPFLLLFVACSQARSQAIAANDGSGGATNISDTAHKTVATPEPETDAPASPPAPRTSEERPYGWHTAIYPALAWVPIFGTSVTLPPLPSQPIAPGTSGSTSGSFNGAYFGGARFEKGKWSADALFMWAALSGERTTPHTSVDLDFIFGDIHVGREVLPNLYLEDGFRRLALDLHATVDTDSASGSPGYWDPLIGLTYRRQRLNPRRIRRHRHGLESATSYQASVRNDGQTATRPDPFLTRPFRLSLEEKWKWCFLSDDFRDMYVIRIVPSDCAKFFGPESLLTYGAYFVF